MKWTRLPQVQKYLGIASALGLQAWMKTLDYRAAYYEPQVDPAWSDCQPSFFLQWHEYIPAMLHHRASPRIHLLVSRHGDGEILHQMTTRLGFGTVRGSSRRGGAEAVKHVIDQLGANHMVITPDGPRGPRRRMSTGPIFLASKLGRPLVCLGIGFDRPWRFNSWDRFAVPRPYSRARVVLGPPLFVPANLNRDGLEHHRLHAENMLNRLTLEAEAWAESRTEKTSSYPFLPRRLPDRLLHLIAESNTSLPDHSPSTLPFKIRRAA